MIVNFALYLLLLLVSLLIYFKIAQHFDIVDYPVNRSSHDLPTIRGGGIIFTLSGLLWFWHSDFESPYAIIGLILISLISFIDDVKSLSGRTRLIVHSVSIALLLADCIYPMHWYLILASFVLSVAWINAFNFMDGINGITAFYALISLGSISLINNASALLSPFLGADIPSGWEPFLPESLLGIVFLGVLVFTFFNARKKARTFAGDIGSVSMAFILSWMMLILIENTRSPFWLLFFSVYGIDSFSTIIIRIVRKENIFKPHRLHMYQLLANEMKWPHLKVALIYAIIQLLINITTIILYFKGFLNWLIFALVVTFMLTGYLAIRKRIVL